MRPISTFSSSFEPVISTLKQLLKGNGNAPVAFEKNQKHERHIHFLQISKIEVFDRSTPSVLELGLLLLFLLRTEATLLLRRGMPR